MLVGAEKGILIAQRDDDGDGDLDFITSEGFENDPSDSNVAQRFASSAMERDRTVRDEGVGAESGAKTAADQEIDNLVAIPIYILDRFSAVIVCANKPGGFHEYEEEVLLALGDHAGAVLENGRLQGRLRGSYLSTVRMLADAIEAKDSFLRGHSDEVSVYVSAVADRLGVDAKRREELVFASLLHDVGKIGISERILLKPGKLTPEEYNVIKLHPRIGYRLVQQVPALDPIALGILHHHERYDGDGYPTGLNGEEIPLEARIICVADSFSAMTAERPYRGRMSLEDACRELERCAGTQFDPEVVRIFVDEVRRRPPSAKGVNALNEALTDPELDLRREGEEPVLGHDSIALTDNLTLLYTHRYFHEMAHAQGQQAEVQRTPFSVLMIEIDGIRELNATEGYVAGDRAIRAAGQALQRAAVRCGGTACRYSGHRLALIMPGSDDKESEECARSIVADLPDGPRVLWGAATWRPGLSGDDVIAEARSHLELRSERVV